MTVSSVVSSQRPNNIESYEKIAELEKDQHQRLLDVEFSLSQYSHEYAFIRNSSILEERLSTDSSLSELKRVLKIRLVILTFMHRWLQCTQYAKRQYQLEVEYLNKAANLLQNLTIPLLTAQNKKISRILLTFRDYLSYTQMKFIDSPVKLSHKGALQAPFLFDKIPLGEILKERSACQRAIHEKEFSAEQLQKSIQYTENEVQHIHAAIQKCGWIRRGCSALLDFLLWRP